MTASVLKYNCDSCFRDISSVVHIQCAECEEVDLCVECFGNGTQLSTAAHHLSTHPYRVIPPLCELPGLGGDKWRADEELVLIEALEANGMGNWGEVSEQLAEKSPTECLLHYATVHLQPSVLPDLEAFVFHPVYPHNSAPSHPAMHEIAGYMPGRGEYEVEWENDFELNFLKDVSIGAEDEDRELKLIILKHYYGIIEERQARRSYALQSGVTKDFKKTQQQERSRSRTEQRVLQHLRPFARFISADFEKLVSGVVEEEELRRKIGQLQEYRRAGMRSFSQVNAFEQDQKHLDLYLKGGGSIMHILDASSASNASNSHGVAVLPFSVGNINVCNSSTRKASAPLNIINMEGYEVLSEKERHICSILRLYPRLYLSIKDTLIREYLKHGSLRRAQARAAVKIDVNKTSKLYDFFVSAGWVRPANDGD